VMRLLAFVPLVVVFFAAVGDACTCLLVGKKATVDGSVMCTHSDDGNGKSDPRLMLVPARISNSTATRPIYPDTELYPRYVGYSRGKGYYPQPGQNVTQPIGYIPQVPRTYSLFEATYGVMNEMQVGIGETSCSSKITSNMCTYVGQREKEANCALLSIDELSRIALERASTARQAVTLMGALAEQYGFYGVSTGVEEGAETLMVIDPNEGFVFHILPSDSNGTSAIWIAQRVPDDSATVVANMFTIRQVNLSDTFNFLGSSNMHDIAQEHGWWDPTSGEPLDFTAVFSSGEYAHKYYSGRRMWRALSLFAPSLNLDPSYDSILTSPPYPWSVVPEKLLDDFDLIAIHRDSYAGTEFDMRVGLAAGPFGTPNRYEAGAGEQQVHGSWERPIDLFRTTYINVNKARSWLPNEIGGLFWFAQTGAHGSCFTPFFAGLSNILPSAFSTGWGGEFSRNTSYWAFRSVNTLMDLKYSYALTTVQQAQALVETASKNMVTQLEHDFLRNHDAEYVAQHIYDNAQATVKTWWQLSDQLLFMYADGYRNFPVAGEALGYPAWWLQQVGYENGPPPPERA